MEKTKTAMFSVCRGLTAKSKKISQVFRRSNSCMAVHLMPRLSILPKSWTGEWRPPSGLKKLAAVYLKELREMMTAATRAVDERCVVRCKGAMHRNTTCALSRRSLA